MDFIKGEDKEVYDALVFEEDAQAWEKAELNLEKAEIRAKLNAFGKTVPENVR